METSISFPYCGFNNIVVLDTLTREFRQKQRLYVWFSILMVSGPLITIFFSLSVFVYDCRSS